MSKKTYLLILLLVIAATYLAYRAVVPAKNKEQNPPPPTRVTIPLYQATLTLSPNPLVLSPAQPSANGSFDVLLDTSAQKATAVQLELSYDPKVLSGVDVAPGTFFNNPVVLIKNIDTAAGHISYAIAIAPTGEEKQGKGVVATISFTANTQSAKATQISFLPKTLVTAQGITTSILKSSSGATVLFQTTPSVNPTSSLSPSVGTPTQ